MEFVLNPEVPIEKYFEEMTRIPHGSFHEKEYSDYLVRFARTHGLSWEQDAIGNVVIRKGGTAGYEDHPVMILQAHMDMVWAKDSGSGHDFEKEPLKLYMEDGFLYARGTTLGADDGTGVSYMLAILESDTISHPPLECIFTVQEEVGMFGASFLNKEGLKGRRFLSLDDGGAVSTMIAAAGGMRMELKIPAGKERCGSAGYEIAVSGLLGGHSGSCISKERGNAIKLAARLLHELKKEISLRLVSIDGGEKENAIPRNCVVTFASSETPENIREAAERLFGQLKEELKDTDGEAEFSWKETSVSQALSENVTERVLELLYLLPTGLRNRNLKLHVPEASENLAVVYTNDEEIVVNYSLRAASESRMESMAEELRLLVKAFGGTYEEGARYPAWPYREESEMRRKLAEAYRKKTGEELQLVAVHGGVECGIFASAIPDMDIITFGSRGLDVHTPREHLDLQSFHDCFEIVKELLKSL